MKRKQKPTRMGKALKAFSEEIGISQDAILTSLVARIPARVLLAHTVGQGKIEEIKNCRLEGSRILVDGYRDGVFQDVFTWYPDEGEWSL